MSKTTNDWMAKFEAEAKRQRKRLPAIKRRILAALNRARIATVEVAYDGEGDEGQIGEITSTDRKGKPAALEGSVLLTLHSTRCSYTLAEALEEFTWEVLAAYHDGFENNEGGFGTLSIDVASGTVSLSHNNRFVDFSTTLTEV